MMKGNKTFSKTFRDGAASMPSFKEWKERGGFHYRSRYNPYSFVIYNSKGEVLGYVVLSKEDYNATMHNSHAKLTWEQFNCIYKLRPERWVIINKNTVGILKDGCHYEHKQFTNHLREITYLAEIKNFDEKDIVFCYDITGFRIEHKLYSLEKSRLEGALTLNNDKNPEAAIDYLINITQKEIENFSAKTKKEIEQAENKCKEIVERLASSHN